MARFDNTFKRKVIYIFSIDDKSHEKCLKIGDATVHSDLPIDKLFPNSSTLNKVAHDRIKSYTGTAGIKYKLLHTELALRQTSLKNGKVTLKAFRDHNVHNVLQNSGYYKKSINGTNGQEWFEVDFRTALNAIDAVKNNKNSLSPDKLNVKNYYPIVFRPEQEIAIKSTTTQFKHSNKMLWNAKMRFGKTVCALEVVKQMKFKKTIIATHRPVVNDSWYEDFNKIFIGNDEYEFGSKSMKTDINDLLDSHKNFVYFMSIQDLRGSEKAGGKFNKNDEIFSVDWDFVVVDEAHEGTQTTLGETVVSNLVKEKTKFLALSGTPFNIVKDYEASELYTWDYVMEQKAKNNWDIEHFGDSNPYEELPELNIFTYNLGKILGNGMYSEIEDKAFNFKEFFRTWTGDISRDFKAIPNNAQVGDFVHSQDVISFLNLITKSDNDSNYPYSSEEYRNLFKHSLWMLPGVKEAKALSKLMNKHSVFGNGMFDIVNVAGDGDEDEESKNALDLVKNSISNASKIGKYTITLSCGKLTTGVTVPEWTAVMMLSGSFSTSAANYLQTIFRVQSPANIDGKIKENCFVFDFAPDRTLKMVADAVNLSSKAGKTSSDDRTAMGEFLNFCPVISVDGTIMKKYDTNNLLQQLKRAYAERAVRNGFDDTSIYNDIELSKLTENDLTKFEELRKIVGSSKTQPKTDKIDVNVTGLTNEEYKELEKAKNKPKKERTPEEQARLDELKKKQDNRAKAISNLRAISIRIPLLIYGADVDFNDDITAEKLVDIVDDTSWEEFMPTGIDKQMFTEFIKYYDADVFIAAGRKIKSIVKQADLLSPTERVQKITELFKGFKNPDKETVLTPWRVVNMHMSDCLGGYDFFDTEHKETIEIPRFVYNGQVTNDTFSNSNAKILEINSKTGLYPLYATYSIFRAKCPDIVNTSIAEQNEFWKEAVKENVFVICKTLMAKAITKRTLLGYGETRVNSHYFEDLINMLKNKPSQFIERVLRPGFWNLKGSEKMKFDAVIGNPPYMEMDGGAQASAKPIYNNFIEQSKKLQPAYLSMVIPTRWYAGGKGLDDFRDTMLNDINLRELHDFTNPDQLFPNTNIRGGVCYFLWDNQYNNKNQLVRVVSHNKNAVDEIMRPMKIDGAEIFIRDYNALSIINKIQKSRFNSLDKYISSLRPFGFRGYFAKDERYKSDTLQLNIPILCYAKGKQIGYVEKEIITVNKGFIDKWKVFIPRANNIGTELNDDNLNSFVGKPDTICTESYLCIGASMNLDEQSSNNLAIYLKSKFSRYLHSLAKASQDATSKTFKFVPLQDFTEKSDIDWTKSISEIDQQLYKKYNLTKEEIDFIESMIKPME